MSIIQDGAGTGNRVKVRGNKLFSHTITEDESLHASENGDAYNINTGTIGLTSTTASGVLYIKNNESRDLVIDRKSTRLNSSHSQQSRMPSSA